MSKQLIIIVLTLCATHSSFSAHNQYLTKQQRVVEQQRVHSLRLCWQDLNDPGRYNAFQKAIIWNAASNVLISACNDGCDPNQTEAISGDTPAHGLFRVILGGDKTILEKVAILSWAGADFDKKNMHRETPIELLNKTRPNFVGRICAEIKKTPAKKAAQIQRLQALLLPLMDNKEKLSDLVREYSGPPALALSDLE